MPAKLTLPLLFALAAATSTSARALSNRHPLALDTSTGRAVSVIFPCDQDFNDTDLFNSCPSGLGSDKLERADRLRQQQERERKRNGNGRGDGARSKKKDCVIM